MIIKKLQQLKAKKGFTLVELLVVIAIIGILAAVLIPLMVTFLNNANISNANSVAATTQSVMTGFLLSESAPARNRGINATTATPGNPATATVTIVAPADGAGPASVSEPATWAGAVTLGGAWQPDSAAGERAIALQVALAESFSGSSALNTGDTIIVYFSASTAAVQTCDAVLYIPAGSNVTTTPAWNSNTKRFDNVTSNRASTTGQRTDPIVGIYPVQ